MGVNVFTEDLKIAKSILAGNQATIREYFYSQCAPLFQSIYKRYYTDCGSCLEFINEIYLLILTPSKKTGHCQLENYRGESTLSSWLKTVCVMYCYKKYKKRGEFDKNRVTITDSDAEDSTDRIVEKGGSIDIDLSKINASDADRIIGMMANNRYQDIIRLRYIKNLSNEETAKMLGMSMDNFYNKHKLAKEQFIKMLKKEEHYG